MKKLCAFTIAFFSLKFCLILCSLTEPNCFWKIKKREVNDGDLQNECGFVLFTLESPIEENFYNHIINFSQIDLTENMNFFLVMFFATDEINKNPYLLSNMSLIFSIIAGLCEDTLGFLDKAYSNQNNNFQLINYFCGIKQRCDIGLRGPSWTTSLKLSIYSRTPKIFFGPFNPNLSDHDQFPYIYQIATKETYLLHGMVSLMFHFEWTWIGLVITDDDQGIQFHSDLREEMQRHVICLAFVIMIPESIQLYNTKFKIYDQQLMTSSSKFVIVYGKMNSTQELSFRRWAYLIARRIWITTSQLDVITYDKDFSLDFFHGTVIFAHHHNDIAIFRIFMQTINTSKYPVDISQSMLQWNHFNCSISKNKKKMDFFMLKNPLEWLTQHTFDMVLSEEGYNLYNAGYAVAHTYHELIFQQVESQEMAKPKGLFTDCQQVASLLKTRVFTNPVGELVNMSHKENQCAKYDIFIIWNFPKGLGLKVKIGSYFPCLPQSQQLHISEDWEVHATEYENVPSSVCSETCIAGFRKSHQKQTADCCFDCVQCQENEIANDTPTDMEQCVRCPDYSYANLEQTKCLQRVVTFLAYEDPLGMALGCLALSFSAITILVLVTFVKYRDTPIVKANNRILSYILLISLVFCFLCSLLFIGHPNQATCILQQATFAIFFTVAISTVLAKTVTVVTAFKLTTPGRRIRKMMIKGATNLLIPICTLIQLVLCGIWLVTSPPFIDRDMQSEHGKIIITCNKGSVIAFHFVLGYLGSLALGSFTVAFLARNLPDRFNEAKFLTFSMLVFYSVWITFLPVYHSTRGKVMVVLEVFSILASSAGLLGCIFIQKCYVLLLRPDLNVLQK
ncbi:vomeronasal 2 receptor, 65 precursor [Rattus norvegicus]|uniref:vomeronasal 2 receptor, 65 precursor n=1 Tax=Rattus norvegicus TaxID=10116 RepID=UPI00015968C7|nr:vomeronasal 2 receptor, 65 precursor [Rattus norvegicus]|eukprot:NP_001093124.1 vomeronasal 2 receptor, 65 precursor [Rattus norvegicus]